MIKIPDVSSVRSVISTSDMYNDKVQKCANKTLNKHVHWNIQNQPKQCKHKYKEWNLRIHADY